MFRQLVELIVTYTQILGEFPAWIAGWLTIMEFMTAVSGVASGWAAYFKGLLSNFGISMPQALNGTFNPEQGTYIDLLPILVLVLVTGLVLLNSKAALRFNSILVVLKFSALALFILVGIWYIKPENWSDFAPLVLVRFMEEALELWQVLHSCSLDS